MAVGSNINPNFPLPAIDQSSRGFRDNFSTIKTEIENLQGKQIQLYGGVVSSPVMIDSGTGIISINTTVLFTNVSIMGTNRSFVWNSGGILATSNIYYDQSNSFVGFNTTLPRATLDVNGNVRIGDVNNAFVITSNTGNTIISAAPTNGFHFRINGNVALVLDNDGQLGIGRFPDRTLDVQGSDFDVARFRSTLNNTDVTVRLTTSQTNASVAWSLENTNNYSGGIRLNKNGFISVHSGEAPGSGLQTGTEALMISPTSRFIGIGNSAPSDRLVVGGNLRVTGNLMIGNIATVTGSRGANAALASLLTALRNMGLIIDSTS